MGETKSTAKPVDETGTLRGRGGNKERVMAGTKYGLLLPGSEAGARARAKIFHAGMMLEGGMGGDVVFTSWDEVEAMFVNVGIAGVVSGVVVFVCVFCSCMCCCMLFVC